MLLRRFLKAFNLLIIICLILIPDSLSGREIQVKRLPKEINIPSEFISHIEQLSNGYLLFSTSSGARLFDGYQFIPIINQTDSEISPLDTYVYTTLEDSSGNIWFATALGLYQLEKVSHQLIKLTHDPKNKNSLSNNNVREIFEDSKGNIWFGTLNGISHYDPKTKVFLDLGKKKTDGSKNKSIGRIYVFLQEADKFMWVGTSTGLFRVDLNTKQLTKMGGILENSYITSAIQLSTNEIWFGADSAGIFKMNTQTRQVSLHHSKTSSNNKLTSDNIWTLYQDSKGLIWIGYWNSGLSVFDPVNQKTYRVNYRENDPSSLPAQSIELITEDLSGLIWIATNGGAAYFNPASLNITTIGSVPGDKTTISGSSILSINESPDGYVWLGTEEGLERWNPENDEIKHFYNLKSTVNLINPGSIWAIEQVDQEHLLLATDSGIDLLNTVNGKVKHFNEFRAHNGKLLKVAFYAMTNAGNGKFYVASSASTVHLLDPLADNHQLVFDAATSPLTVESEYFNAIHISPQNDLWLGGTTGLYQVNLTNNSVVAFNATNKKNRLSGNVINDIYQQNENTIWIATSNGGINRISLNSTGDNEVKFFSTKQGLPSNEIYNLIPTDKNELWFSTSKHFGQINMDDDDIKLFSLLSQDHERYTAGASFISRENYLYIGGTRLYRFKTDSLKQVDYSPEVRLSGISRLHQPLENFSPLAGEKSVEFFPEDTLITFHFASLDYANPEANQFKYKLDGFDKHWLSPGNEHRASYTHLPHGKYQLLIRGTNRDGRWSKQSATLNVIVHPPFWKSPIAYFVYLIIIISTFGTVAYSRRKKREHEMATMQAIKLSEARLKDVLWGSGDELWRWIIKTNEVIRTKTGLNDNSSKETRIDFDKLFASVHPEDQELVMDMIERHLSGQENYYEAQFRMLSPVKDGWNWVLSRGRIVERDEYGTPLVLAGTTKNIQAIKKTENQLRYLANYDQLTGLPNRALFQEHLNHALQLAQRFHERTALLFLDLDGFKIINDTMGHGVGDQLLQSVAQRLTKVLRGTDNFARLGGDEFAVILERIHTAESIIPTLERVLDSLTVPFELNEQKMVTSISIGIAIYPEDGDSATSLLKHADIAMYEAKRNGKNNYCFYTIQMNQLLVERLDMERQIEIALQEQQFEAFFQPRVGVADNQVKGFEALIRWRHPENGIISPAEFIPIAEETGQILAVGKWILEEACRQASEWKKQGWKGCISVNLAALQFQQSDLVTTIEKVLLESELPAEFLELEITEGTLIQNTEHTRSVILRLKKLGLRIALDDFGTGYSSLSYLQQLPIDILKIDRSFITQVILSKKSAQLSRAIINMAHSLELQVVAEGIEEQSQLQFLKEANCEEYQGYLYGKPVPANEIDINAIIN